MATRTNFITVDRAKEDAEDERDRRCASALASPRVEGTDRPGECAGPCVAACTVVARIWPRVSCFVLPIILLAARVLQFWLGLLHSIALGLVSRLAPIGLLRLRAACPPDSRGKLLLPSRSENRGALCPGSTLTSFVPELECSVAEQARRLRSGQVSAVTLVRAFIQRIVLINQQINAVVADRFESALHEAALADEKLARGRAQGTLDSLPPLLGVPFSAKESFEAEGMPHTSGLLARVGRRGFKDAVAVKRLKAAGAILLCSSNVSELCMWMETYNYVYGLTRNPYAFAHTVGGSSGGEGAVVASCAAAFGLGSDVGGSLRIPANFCGIYAHKPTGGLVSNEGQYPIAAGAVRDVLATGPMCRHARDLVLLLNVLAGGEGQGQGQAVNVADWQDLRGLRVVCVARSAQPLTRGVSAEVAQGLERVAVFLAQRGAVVEQLDSLPFTASSLEVWAGRMLWAQQEEQVDFGLRGRALRGAKGDEGARQVPFKDCMWQGRESRAEGLGFALRLAAEVFKWMAGMSAFTLPALLLSLSECVPVSLLRAIGLDRARVERQVAVARQEVEDLMAAKGEDEKACVVLMPSFPTTAPHHFQPYLRPLDWLYTAVWNALEMPATQVPVGLAESGLPVGVQLVAPRGADSVALGVAVHLEKGGISGWTQPPPAMP